MSDAQQAAPNYVSMTPGELHAALGMDGKKWTDAWFQHVAQNPEIATDEGTMLGWFCNAIMAGFDTAQNRTLGAVRERDGLREEARLDGEAMQAAIDNIAHLRDGRARLKLEQRLEARQALQAGEKTDA